MRSTRNQPFCWQEKNILRLFRKVYSGSLLNKMRNLYLTITEMDSDFNGKDVKYYTKTIATYSGLSDEWIPAGLKLMEDHGIIQIMEDKEKGKFIGKRLIFTPDSLKEIPVKTVTGKTGNGKPVNGFSGTLEDSTLLEDNLLQEDNLRTNKVLPENSGSSIINNNLPVNLNKLSNKILTLTRQAFSAMPFTNVLPANGAETCNTKTYQEIQDFMYNLHELKIRSAYEWDDKWLDRNHIDFKSLREKAIGTNGSSRLPFEEIENLLEKALKNYKLMYQENYWPEKKETLTLNFKHFLYNFNTKKSWFLYCLFNDPVELQDKNAENLIKDLPGDVVKLIKRVGEGDIAASWSKYAFYSKIRDLYTWYEPRRKQFKKYHDLLQMGGFWTKLGTFQDLIDTIFDYIETWRDDWTVNHFGRGCKTWNLFVKWVEKEFGFDLDLDDDDLQQAEKDYEDRYGKVLLKK